MASHLHAHTTSIGYLAGTGTKYQMIHHTSSSLKHKNLPTAPHGTRAFHGSQVCSASLSGACSNRPLSPHLALKRPQPSATYSISHRIFGAALASAIMLSPITMKAKILSDV